MGNTLRQELIEFYKRTIDPSDPDRQYIAFLADKSIEIMHHHRLAVHEVGNVVGQYRITERFKRVGKNTKYKVICIKCNAPMFRYSNKFKLPHKDCFTKEES